MTLEKINQQSTLEIAAMQFRTVVAEADQELILKLGPVAGVDGYLVLLQPSLPSIH